MKNRFMNFMIMGFVSVIFCGFDVLLMKNVVRIIVIIVRRLRVIVFFFFYFCFKEFCGYCKDYEVEVEYFKYEGICVFYFFCYFCFSCFNGNFIEVVFDVVCEECFKGVKSYKLEEYC